MAVVLLECESIVAFPFSNKANLLGNQLINHDTPDDVSSFLFALSKLALIVNELIILLSEFLFSSGDFLVHRFEIFMGVSPFPVSDFQLRLYSFDTLERLQNETKD
ncbi:hypothetical protein PMSM_18945 [Paenibacillus macquariensis subsp. macquariensis]|nr:hypothetical protein PMSM_18945 [Paenibacillus macquariensis subsp. macquariensis]